MILPYQKFLKYLAIITTNEEEFIKKANYYNCPTYLITEFISLQEKSKEFKKNFKNKKFVQFLTEHKILGLFSNEKYREFILNNILIHPVKKRFFELFITARIDPNLIEKIFEEIFFIKLDTYLIGFFRTYFWDISEFSTEDFQKFLVNELFQYPENELFFDAYQIPGELILIKIGLGKYINFNTEEAVENLFKIAYLKAVELAQKGNRVVEFKHASDIALASYQALSDKALSSGMIIEKLKDMKLKQVTVDFPKLKAGNEDG
jgi:hypothetical protein